MEAQRDAGGLEPSRADSAGIAHGRSRNEVGQERRAGTASTPGISRGRPSGASTARSAFVREYQAPRDLHPGSIMSLSSTGAAGRGSQEGDVVGSVILHGKKHLWGRPNRHYHAGLQAGDNTLNLLCARVILRSLNATGSYDAGGFLRDYIAFMTTPGSHDDTYAESYHRDFFANFARGVPPERCAGAEGHDTASIGGLVSLPPVIAAAMREDDPAAVDRLLLAHLRLTHRSRKLERYALALGGLLSRLLRDPSPRVGPLACAAGPNSTRRSSRSAPGSAGSGPGAVPAPGRTLRSTAAASSSR